MIFDFIFIVVVFFTLGKREKGKALDAMFLSLRMFISIKLAGVLYRGMAPGIKNLWGVGTNSSEYITYILIYFLMFVLITIILRNLFDHLQTYIAEAIAVYSSYFFSLTKAILNYSILFACLNIISVIDIFPETRDLSPIMKRPFTYGLVTSILTSDGTALMLKAKQSYKETDFTMGFSKAVKEKYDKDGDTVLEDTEEQIGHIK